MRIPCWLRRLLFLDGRDSRPTLREEVQASSRALNEAAEEVQGLSRTVRAKAIIERRHAKRVIETAAQVIDAANSASAGTERKSMINMLDDALDALKREKPH